MRRPNLNMISGGGRRRLVAAVALVVAVAVVIVLVLSAGSSTPTNAASNTGSATGATTVQRRDLVETDTESGTLSYDDPQTVYSRLSGTITWLPSVGQVIKPGGTLFKVDGAPVILMDGTTPAYRALSSADSYGPDVLELNRNLAKLGFNPDGIVVNDTWQPATTDGVDLLQASLGEAETGSLSLGDVVFLPGDQLLSTVDATLGDGGGGSGAAATPAASAASTTVGQATPEFVSLRSTEQPASNSESASTTATTGTTSTTTSTMTTPATTTAPKRTTKPGKRRTRKSRNTEGKTLAALIGLLKVETAQLQAELKANAHKSSSGHSGSGSSKSGKGSSDSSSSGSSGNSGGGSAQEVLQTTSTRLVVTVDLSASSQSEAVVGEHVTVELPAGSTVGGKITAVSPIAQSSSNSGNGNGGGSGGGSAGGGGNGSGSSSSTVPVTITLQGHHTGAGLDQAAVSVNFVQQRATNVLSVPVTALLATGGGNYAVQEAAAPHRLIPVTTGLFAAGFVQISGSGLYPGLQVTDSQG